MRKKYFYQKIEKDYYFKQKKRDAVPFNNQCLILIIFFYILIFSFFSNLFILNLY